MSVLGILLPWMFIHSYLDWLEMNVAAPVSTWRVVLNGELKASWVSVCMEELLLFPSSALLTVHASQSVPMAL